MKRCYFDKKEKEKNILLLLSSDKKKKAIMSTKKFQAKLSSVFNSEVTAGRRRHLSGLPEKRLTF